MILSGIVITKNFLIKFTFYALLAYFSYLMLLISLQYIPIDFHAAFLNIKEEEIKLPYYQIAFFTHVYTSIFTLIAGFVQFSKTVRSKYPVLHRKVGKFYIGTILFLAGPSGLVMGYHANGGTYSQISFCILAVLWMYFSFKAYRYAREKNWKLHREFIYRSYALTLSAVSLRLFKWVIVSTFGFPPMDTYKIVSWLGWVVNLIVAEILIRRQTFDYQGAMHPGSE